MVIHSFPHVDPVLSASVLHYIQNLLSIILLSHCHYTFVRASHQDSMSRPVSPLHDLLAKAPKASEDFQIAMDETSPYQTHDGTKQNESQFLEPPQHRAPHRPLSPDTLSNLSAEEFDQLGPRNDEPSVWLDGGHQALKPSWTAKWQAKLRASWTRNAGLFYMLLAQVFGVMMNVTTRLLEIEGNKGKGLHPFQVRIRRSRPQQLQQMF